MVSIKRASLPDTYIEAANSLVNELNFKFSVDYAYFFLQYDENQYWIDGDWVLYIASDRLNELTLLNIIKAVGYTKDLLHIYLDEFEYKIIKSNWKFDGNYNTFDKVFIRYMDES